MTEDEAKQKWCPMVRFNPPDGENNRSPDHGGLNNARCIASECAVWKWSSKFHTTMESIEDGRCGLIR